MPRLSTDLLLTGLTIVLLLLFTLTAWLGLLAWATGELVGDRPLGRAFFILLAEPSPMWDLIRTAMAAAVAAIAGAALGNEVAPKATPIVIALLVMFAPLVVLGLVLMDPEIAREVWEPVNQAGLSAEPSSATDMASGITTPEAFRSVWNAYLAGQTQVLATHLALFLGLRVGKKS